MKKLLLLLLLSVNISAFAQQTYVPDDAFEAFLETSLLGNGIANDDSVTTSNINGLGDLIVSAQGIVDLTGIEDFDSLTLIIFDGNPIVSADLSGNLLLTYASFSGCALTSINLNQNSQLETLICSNCSLSSIDVSDNLLLEVFNCNSNSLSSVDVSQNTALTELSINSNPVSSLNVTQNTALLELNCVQNGLTTIDVSQNTALTTLDCRSNSLDALDVSQNIALETLFCRANSITALDVSASPAMNNLNCSFNDLHCLNADNQNTFENPSFPGIYSFICFGNANLACAEVSDPTLANANYYADATTTFDLHCITDVDSSVTQLGTTLTADIDTLTYQWVDCNNNNSPITGATNQSFTPTITGNYAALISFTDPCGTVSTEMSDCFFIDYTGLEELVNSEKELVKIIDLTGRETEFKPNVPLIFLYSDGSHERVMEIEQ